MSNYFDTDEYKNHISHSELQKLVNRKTWTFRVIALCFIPVYIIAFLIIEANFTDPTVTNLSQFLVFIGVAVILELVSRKLNKDYQPLFDAESKNHEAREALCKEARQKQAEELQVKAKLEVDADIKRVLG